MVSLCLFHEVPPSIDIHIAKPDGPNEMAYFLERYGSKGSCYQDSRVTDMIDDGADHTDNVFLLELLRNIHDDWCSEHANDDGNGMFYCVVVHGLFTNIELV